MNSYATPSGSPEHVSRQLTSIEKLVMGASSIAVFVGMGYVFLFPNPNSLSWERNLEFVAMTGLLILYLAVPVAGSLFLMRKGNRAGRIVGTLLAAVPFFIVCGGFLSMLVT